MADSTRPDSTTNNNPNTNNYNDNTSGQSSGFNTIRYLSTKSTQILLLVIRIATLFFTLLYLVPISPISPANLYQKALIANAAVSALKLHIRSTPIRLTREYFAQLLMEDSAHYLLYSLVFIANQPITLVLLPITSFAFLHSCSSLLNIVEAIGHNGVLKTMFENVLRSQRQFLLMIALTEIALMPTIFFSVIAGLANIFTPFLYYQFIILRYASRRNPYSQQAFHWLRFALQNFANSQRCPSFLQTIIYRGISWTCRLASHTLRTQ